MAGLPSAPQDSRGNGAAPPARFTARFLKSLFGDKILFWVLVACFVAADLWTKEIVIRQVAESARGSFIAGGSPVIWICPERLGLVSVGNKGGPFGIFAGSLLLRIVRFLALGVILYLLAATPRKARFQIVSLSMIMGGALGNIWDTMAFGSVRDFLYVDLGFPPANPWPAFNLADSLICTGVALLAFLLYIDWLKERKTRRDALSGGAG